VRRVPQRIDGDALDAAIGDWLTARADACHAADRNRHPPSRPVRAAIAVDGKSHWPVDLPAEGSALICCSTPPADVVLDM
jgi:hypothetical protein